VFEFPGQRPERRTNQKPGFTDCGYSGKSEGGDKMIRKVDNAEFYVEMPERSFQKELDLLRCVSNSLRGISISLQDITNKLITDFQTLDYIIEDFINLKNAGNENEVIK
jgi:hypothetical protein